MLTREEVERALPANLRSAATDQLTQKINSLVSDPETAQMVRDNFIGYANVLKNGTFKIDDYLHAVAYVSFKLMGYTNREAYDRTFPARVQRLMAGGKSSKEISSFVAAYAKNKLVNLIYEQTLIPTWVLNQEAYQEAINTQVDLMRNSGSDLVRTQAANSILTHLKRPEVKEVNLNLGVKENSGMSELKAALTDLANQQLQLIKNGVSPKVIAEQRIIEAEIVDAEIVEETVDATH